MNLNGKVALVTGGGTGIGLAITRRFISEGAKVCITGRRRDILENIAKEFAVDKLTVCQGDVSVFKDAEAMVNETLRFGGKIDVLVNNAGIDPAGNIVDLDINLWHQVININLSGPFYLMKLTIPHMIDNGGGSIINISSLAGVRCIPAMPAYCSSKAGLIMLTKQAALDYGKYGIRCNVVCPGAVRTEMLENSVGRHIAGVLGSDIDEAFKYFTANVPLRRAASPDEISGICVYLGSDDSKFVTGATIMIDGGASIVDVSGAAVTNLGMSWGKK